MNDISRGFAHRRGTGGSSGVGRGLRFPSGIMSIVLNGGEIHAGDRIDVELPPLPHESLDHV